MIAEEQSSTIKDLVPSPRGAQIEALHELDVAKAENIILKENPNNVIGRIYEETIY